MALTGMGPNTAPGLLFLQRTDVGKGSRLHEIVSMAPRAGAPL
jgi:hypothetical protein